MNNLNEQINNYLDWCKNQKRLDSKTIKSYRIDLQQFSSNIHVQDANIITPYMLEYEISNLHNNFSPKTVKRKIASIKAFFRYLNYRELIDKNPFDRVHVKFREPTILPKTIPLKTVEAILSIIHTHKNCLPTLYQRRNALRDAAVIELLFSTGIRISELCSLKTQDFNFYDRTILISGKGSKERKLQIGNDDVNNVLLEYKNVFSQEINRCEHFFVNQNGNPLSDQSVRRMINKYTALISEDLHITPHMFRHTFATSLLDADVDIRYIQEILGHSSINVTQIYTHVAMEKQRYILSNKHPRKDFQI